MTSTFFDSLNYNPSLNLASRGKNPYAIPANLNHRHIPDLMDDYSPYVPPHANLTNEIRNDDQRRKIRHYEAKPMVFKEQHAQKQNLAFTIEIAKPKIESKVFNRLFPKASESQQGAPSRNLNLNLTKATEEPNVNKPQKPNCRSIFKNYKSCPVSPVSEECKWVDKTPQSKAAGESTRRGNTNSLDPKKRNSLSFFVGLDGDMKDSGKTIVDSIKHDTERMIAEITKKYGDLDEYDPSMDELDLQPSKEVLFGKEDGNFSSDSLEDCSLSQDASCKNKLYSKKICKKHSKAKGLPRRAFSNYEISGISDKPRVPAKPAHMAGQKSSTLPRNMPSNLDDIIYEDSLMNVYPDMYRCQSVLTKRCVTRSNESVLSDNSNGSSVSNEIFLKYGNEVAFQQAKVKYINESRNCSLENINDSDLQHLDNNRHSSASFFLNQKKYMKNSQESVLSDEYLDHENELSRTNCNSLESVLSDESEYTKSAPLEMLFGETKFMSGTKATGVSIPRSSKSCYEFENASKSYGSSPNYQPCFGGYRHNNFCGESSSPREQYYAPLASTSKAPTTKTCGFEIPAAEVSEHKTVERSKSLYDSSSKDIPKAKNIAYYFDGSNVQHYTRESKAKDEIPRLKKGDYMGNNTKSLQPNFAEKQKCKMADAEQNTMVKSKSCSFEIVLETASKPNPLKNLMEKRKSHVQKNLELFEDEIRKSTSVKSNKLAKKDKTNAKHNNVTKSLERGSGHHKSHNGKITMEFVPHKPPKPINRTSSVKLNNRLKASFEKGANSTISSHYKAKLDGLQNKNFLGNKNDDKNSNHLDNNDNQEKTFHVFVKEKDVNENKSEIQMDSLEVFALQRMERMKQVSMDSLDVLEDRNDFAKDSLDYYAEQQNYKLKKDLLNLNLRKKEGKPCNTKENGNPISMTDELKKYKYIERKLEIINKLVEMEERKMLQERILKEYRMRPLKANIDDGKGVVKVLSKKFEKLASNPTLPPNFTSLTLEEADIDTGNSENQIEIKRNLSLPDILDTDQMTGLVTSMDSAETTKHAENLSKSSTETDLPVKLNNTLESEPKVPVPKQLSCRVYNEVVIPKTDLHLDSENYESSTTSSSCNNSPKRLSFHGFSCAKTPFSKKSLIRIPTPRLCMENRIFAPTSNKLRPLLSGNIVRSSLSSTPGQLARRVPIQVPLLPSRSPLPGARACFCPDRCR